jgi:hypothetical protein
VSSYYVDPSIDADSGAGTIGDPYGDLQYALDNITGSNAGNVINIKAGTAEVLTGTLDFSTYGTPSFNNNPVTFAGYTSAEHDGGIGEIDGNGLYSIYNEASGEGVLFRDLTIGNCGANPVATIDRFLGFYNCKIHGTSGNAVVGGSDGVYFDSCWFDDVAGYAASAVGVLLTNCLFTDGTTNVFGSTAILEEVSGIVRCCFEWGTAAAAVSSLATRTTVEACSFLTTNASAVAVDFRAIRAGNVNGNLMDGGAYMFDVGNSEKMSGVYRNNSGNVATGVYSGTPDDADSTFVNNEVLASSPFAKTGSISAFADRLTYFAPVDTGDVLSHDGGLARGAVQPASSGGGSTVLVIED